MDTSDRPVVSRRRMLARTAAAGGVAWVTPAILASPSASASASEGVGAVTCGTVSALSPASSFLQHDPPPASADEDQTEDNRIQYWLERARVTVGAGGVSVDQLTATGSAGVIPAGTDVATFLFHYDRPNNGAEFVGGTVTFTTPILGIVTSSARLDATDEDYGSPTTAYPADGTRPARGLESNDAAGTTESAFALRLQARQEFDQVRVFLACQSAE